MADFSKLEFKVKFIEYQANHWPKGRDLHIQYIYSHSDVIYFDISRSNFISQKNAFVFANSITVI